MSVRGHMALLVLAAVAANAAADERTLKDLRAAPPQVRAGETVQPDPDRARELYRGFLEMEAGDPALRTEALRRLGDLELDAGEAARGEVPVAGAGSPETRAAIDIYTRLLAEQPDYPRADSVLYQLARAWEAEGEADKALARLDELVARFPASRHIDEAQFRRGEILFSAQRWHDAELAYAAVIAAGAGSEFHEQALYKHGWSLFKQSQTELSAQSFFSLLDRKLSDPGAEDGTVDLEALPRADRELVSDTIRALSIQFAALDAAATLDAAVAAHGSPSYGWLLYAALGDMLVEKERFTDGADTYRAFVKRDPAHRRAPSLQGRAIDAYLKGGFADLALEGKREFVSQYRFGAPFWDSRQPADAPEVVAELKSHLQDVARYQHALAQSSGQRADYAEAARWYREYLVSFPDEPDSAATNHLLADALFEAGDYLEATIEYERTAYNYAPDERAAQAGYAALVSFGKQEAAMDGAARDIWHRASIDSSLRFAEAFPLHPEAGAMRLRAAQQLFNLDEYEEASRAALLATAHQPPLAPDAQRTAWNVVADAAFELGRYQQAEAAYAEVLARMPAADGGRAAITERLAAVVYKQGEAKQQAGDVDGAVDDYLRIAALAPTSGIRATAQYDAAALLVREQQWQRAIPVLEAFRRDYPDHPLAASVPRNLALAYGESGRPLEAAVEFDRIADNPEETAEVRRAALVEAAGLYEQGGDRARTAAAWARFVERYPEPLDEANTVRLKLADMARDAGDTPTRQRWLAGIVAADAAAGPARSESSRLMAARAALELAGPARQEFESIVLKAPLPKSLKAKRAAMEKALAAYQAAADYRVAEVTTAATYATAELYRRLATDLMASERPPNLGPDELEQYELLLEEQAYPFEERAIELHETNAARAREGLFDASVQGSYAALAGLKPARYARAELPAAPETDGEPMAGALAAARAGDWEAAEAGFARSLEVAAAQPTVPVTVAGAAATPAPSPAPGPAAAEALTGLGLVYRNTGRFALAAEAYRSALQSNPAYGPALLNLAILLDLYLQQPAAALEQYRAYQATLPEPDAKVGSWIREVEIRAGDGAARAEASP